MPRTTWMFLSFTVVATHLAPAQTIVGRTLDLTSGNPVIAAEIELVDSRGETRARSITDSLGWFRLSSPQPGKYFVRANSIGYAVTRSDTVTLAERVELQVELQLSATAVPVTPLRIVAQRTLRPGHLAAYFDRAEWSRKTGLGRVYTRDEVSRMGSTRVSSLLSQFPARSNCRYTYMLDNLPMAPDEIDRSILMEDVEGIEIYRALHQVPPEYSHRTSCGLVMIWTRNDQVGKPLTWTRALVFLTLIGGAILLVRR